MNSDQWIIIDTETTGLTQPISAVEIAAQRMEGWAPVGEPFRILLNHDVYIEPEAEAVHGYTQEYLRKHGIDPLVAHKQFHDYCGCHPVVAFNISYDWNRVLAPEYERLNVPQTGEKGFCALTLARRTITETPNLKLPTLKEHFKLSVNPSHSAINDVEALVNLFTQVMRQRLEPAGISSFDELAKFSKSTPVAKCLEKLHLAYDQQEVWHIQTEDNESAGPFSLSRIRELTEGCDCYLWREGMLGWELSSKLPEFSESFLMPKKKSKATKSESKSKPRVHSQYQESVAEVKASLNQLVGLCKGILADGIISEDELLLLYDWIESCPYTHIYPMSIVADTLEKVCEDGVVTTEEQAELAKVMNEAIAANE